MSERITMLPHRAFLRIKVPDVLLLREPGEGQYHFVFRIVMSNTSSMSIRLLGRKWMIHDENDQLHILEGEKVFGETPVLRPGAVFSYGGSKILKARPLRIQLQFFGMDQVLLPFISPPFLFPSDSLKLLS